MDRRSFLKTTGAAATAAGIAAPATQALSAPAVIPLARELAVALPWPDAVAGPHDDARRLLAAITAATEGRLRFVIPPPAARRTGTCIDSVARGDAGLYVASDDDHVGLDPAFAWFAGLPGGMGLPPDAHEAWLIAAGGQMLWDELGREHGVKPLLAGHLGAPAGLWSARPIADAGDVAGMILAAGGLAQEVARGLGANAVAAPPMAAPPMAAPPMRHAPATQGYGLATDLALGRPGGARHYYTGGLSPWGTTQTLAFSRRIWDGLSGSDRICVSGIAAMAWRESIAASRLHQAVAVAALRAVHGIEPEPLPSGLGDQIDRIAEVVVAHAAGSTPGARAADLSLMAYLRLTGRNHFAQPIG